MKEWHEMEWDEWDNLVASVLPSNRNLATLPAVSTTKNVTTTTPATVAAKTEQFKSISSAPPEQAMDSVVAQFKNGIGARDISSVSPTIATAAFGATGKTFTDKNGLTTSELGNFSTGYTDQIKSFTSALTSATSALKNSSGELKKDGIAFVAGTTRKLFEGIDLPGVSDFKSFTNLGTGQLFKLASLGEDAFKSVNDGLKAVTSSLGEIYQAANEGLHAISSTISEVGGAVLEPIKDIATTAYTLSDPRLANVLVQSNLDFLPPNIRSMLGSKAQSAVSGVTGDFHSKAGSILGKAYSLENILGTVSAEGLLYGIYQTGNGSGGYGGGYNSISGDGGIYLHGQSSYTGTHSQYGSLATAVAQLCGKDPVGGTYRSYSDEKDLYDILLAAALQTNAGQILAGLMACSKGTQYNDGRSLNIVRRNTPQLVASGDTYTYGQLAQQYGSDFTRTPEEDILSLYINSNNTPEARNDIAQIAKLLDVETDTLLAEKSFSSTVYDGGKVTAIQYANASTQSEFLSSDEYAAINAALALYRSDAVHA